MTPTLRHRCPQCGSLLIEDESVLADQTTIWQVCNQCLFTRVTKEKMR